MLTPPSKSTDQRDDGNLAITSQIDELKQLFLDHERIIEVKSTTLESISDRLNDLQVKSDFDAILGDVRSHLNSLLNSFQGKLVSSYPEQGQIEERENKLLDTFESSITMENEHSTETPHETISRLLRYLHSDGHNLGTIRHCFNDIVDSTNGLMSSIPKNKTNTTHMNELITLIEGCIGSFRT